MILGEEIWIPFPEHIVRLQKRREFRIDLPQGTCICIEKDKMRYELEVINLSMGGASSIFFDTKGDNQDVIKMQAGDILENIELIPPSKKDSHVRIRKTMILRITFDGKTKQHRLVLQFLEIEKAHVNALKTLIYNIQRAFLKNRLKLNS